METAQDSNWIVGVSWRRRLATLGVSVVASALLLTPLIRRDGLPVGAFATRRAVVAIVAGAVTILACIAVAELITRQRRIRAGHEPPAV